jgi:hypothetical protein
MRSDQREAIRMPPNSLNVHFPAANRVTVLARSAELTPVDIGMTRRAGGSDLAEDRFYVTRRARQTGMKSSQRETSLKIVIEVRCSADRLPRRRRMATSACDVDLPMWILRRLLRNSPWREPQQQCERDETQDSFQ